MCKSLIYRHWLRINSFQKQKWRLLQFSLTFSLLVSLIAKYESVPNRMAIKWVPSVLMHQLQCHTLHDTMLWFYFRVSQHHFNILLTKKKNTKQTLKPHEYRRNFEAAGAGANKAKQVNTLKWMCDVVFPKTKWYI